MSRVVNVKLDLDTILEKIAKATSSCIGPEDHEECYAIVRWLEKLRRVVKGTPAEQEILFLVAVFDEVREQIGRTA